MPFYLVRARLKRERAAELRDRLRRGELARLRPFGRALTRSLEAARLDPATGDAVWEEEDYCNPPLAQERAAVLDHYFEAIRVTSVREGEGWARIAALPPLWTKV